MTGGPDQPTAPKPAASSLRQRVVSAIVLLPVAVAAIWFGGWVFAGFVALAGFVMAWEWGRMVHGRPWGVETVAIAAAVLLGAVTAMTTGPFHGVLAAAALWAAMVIRAVAIGEPIGWHGLAIPYVCIPIIALILLRNDPDYGLVAILWLFCVIWATDICAYFTGRTLGGPKLAPRASPNKTWSGLIGGIIGAAVVGLATARVLDEGGYAALMILSGALAVAGQAGDIGESAIKRRFGYKDSSAIIPGHGGVMDRVDGLVTAATVTLIVGWVHGGSPSVARGALIW